MLIYDLMLLGIIVLLFILYLLYLIFSSRSTPTTTPTTLKGREGFVLEEIRPENIKGKVRVIHSSRIWSATADEIIEEGTKVKINKVEGVHLIVEKVRKDEEIEEERGRILKHFARMSDYIRDSFSSVGSSAKKKPVEEEKETVSELEGEILELAEDLSETSEHQEGEEDVSEPLEEEAEEKGTLKCFIRNIEDGCSSAVCFLRDKIKRKSRKSEEESVSELEEEVLELIEEEPSEERDVKEEEIEEEKLFSLLSEKLSLGYLISIFGVLIIIAVLVLKFVGPGELPLIGEYPIGEINPDDHLSIHFFVGIVIGTVVLIVGVAISMIKKMEKAKDLDEDLQKELQELEEEIEEEGVCPTCGALIPVNAEVCIECGEELEPLKGSEEESEEEENIERQNCSVCGAEVSDEDERCPECNEPLGEISEEDIFEEL